MHNSILSGHLGRKKTKEKVLQRYYWYQVREDVNLWVSQCDVCEANKPPVFKPRAPLGSMPVGTPLDRLSTDLTGPFPRTPRGNRYILVVTDQFSKWVEIIAIPDQTAETTARTRLLQGLVHPFQSTVILAATMRAGYLGNYVTYSKSKRAELLLGILRETARQKDSTRPLFT